MPYCIAKHCTNSDRNNPRKARFHLLPTGKRRKHIRRQWLAKCARPEPKNSQARVCSEHFKSFEDYSESIVKHNLGFLPEPVLNADAVPSIFFDSPPSSSTPKRPVEKSPSTSVKSRRIRNAARSKQKLFESLPSPQCYGAAQATVSSPGQDLNETIEFETGVPENRSHDQPLSAPVIIEGDTKEEVHCKCCKHANPVSTNEVSVQTDMDDILDAIAKDHTYFSTSKKSEPSSSLTQPPPSPFPIEVQPISPLMEISHAGALFSPVVPPEIIHQNDEPDISMMDISLDTEDDVKDLDFVPDTESESDSEFEQDQDPSDEPATATDFEDIGSFSVPENAADERKFLVFESCLINLFRKCQKTGCAAEVFEFKRTVVGSRLIVSTKCTAGCNYTWSSQPTLNRMGAGNMLLSAAILFSGNTYARLQDISAYLKLPILCQSQFYALQKRYLFPVINETWISCQFDVVNELSRVDKVVLSGDGRCDSPGHCAKYGTYTLMDVNSGFIVDFTVLNKADPLVKNSNAMEPMGLKQCLSNMKKWKIKINILTTDRHKTVRKIIRVEYPEITHQFDLWHFCKSIVKKIVKACGKKAPLAPLLEWLQSISNHFWWCAESCEGNVDVLQEKWESILYHTANIHVWQDKELFHACEHPPLQEDSRFKSWLTVGSPAHDALTKVVKNRDILGDLKFCALYCHTGDLEVYHSLMIKYAPKRQHFSYEGMVSRTQLAAIDHNYGVGRQHATTKSNQLTYNMVVPKSFSNKKKWVAKPVKTPKAHSYREDMMRDVVLMRTHDLEKSHVDLPEVCQNMYAIERPAKNEIIQATLANTRFRNRRSTSSDR